MKRFQFPLDRVRRWRSEQADVEELKLRHLRDRLSSLDQEKLNAAQDRARSEQDVLSRPSIESAELESLESYRQHIRFRIRDVENRQRQVEAEIAKQLQKVIAARQQAQLLVRLKQKARAGWQAANDREQETLATELFLAKLGRRPWLHGSSRSP